jgi:hypothetical protein
MSQCTTSRLIMNIFNHDSFCADWSKKEVVCSALVRLATNAM